MKIACISDLHLNIVVYTKIYDSEYVGLPFRNGDFMRAFQWNVDKCINEIKPDLVVIGGDVYDYYEPTNEVRGFFSNQIERFIEAKIPVIILIGNHDVCSKHHALKDIQELKLKSIRVIEKPQIIKYKDTQLLLFPYSLDIERKVVSIKEEFNKFVAEFKSKDDKSPAVFFGHFGVRGGTLSEYNVQKANVKIEKSFLNTNDKDVSVEDLDTIGAGHVILGDYHQHQVFDTKNCHAMYTGSIEKTDFSEIKQPKGFILYDSDGKDNGKYGKCQFIAYPNCRPMIELKGNMIDMKKQFSEIKYENYSKAIVKFSFVGTKDESIAFSLGLREFKRDIVEKISPIHMVHEQKIRNVQQEKEVTELQNEIIANGNVEEDQVLNVLKEMIEEREKDDAEREILKLEMADIYNKSRGV